MEPSRSLQPTEYLPPVHTTHLQDAHNDSTELQIVQHERQQVLLRFMELEKRIQALKCKAPPCSSEFPPVARLPADILAYTFLLAATPGSPSQIISPTIVKRCTAGEKSTKPWIYADMEREIPWTIAAVCTQWRKIAISSRTLWSYFNIDILVGNPLQSTAQNRMVPTDRVVCTDITSSSFASAFTLQMQRSLGAQLHVEIRRATAVDFTPVLSPGVTREMMDTLFRHAQSFQHLRTHLSLLDLLACPFSSPMRVIVDKHRLTVRPATHAEQRDAQPIPLALDVPTPSLLDNLLNLHLASVDIGRLNLVLSDLQNRLVTLHVDDIHTSARPDSETTSSNASFILPNLKALKLCYTSSESILPLISAPALESFIAPSPSRHFRPAFEAFIVQSSCSLTSLHLGRRLLSSKGQKLDLLVDDIWKILKNPLVVKNLKELYVSNRMMMLNSVFACGTSAQTTQESPQESDPSQPPPKPQLMLYSHLEKLTLGHIRVISGELVDLLKKLHHSGGHSGNLNYVHMEDMRLWGRMGSLSSIQRDLDKLKAAGMVIKLSLSTY